MVDTLKHMFERGSLMVTGAVFALTIASAGFISVIQPQTVAAASCDKVNIVYCGIGGGSVNSTIDSFQKLYNNGSNNGHNDLKTVYRWAGATDKSVANMDSSNTKLGTLYKNGNIKVNDKVIATDAWVSARFGSGQNGFKQVTGGVYARKTTTSFAESSATVLVHFAKNGQMKFAVMTGCGNAVKATPKPQPTPEPKPQPKPQPKPKAEIECVSLEAKAIVNIPRKYTFTAKASVQNTTITGYSFNYGDGQTEIVKSSQVTATATHQFAKDGTSYTVTVTVNGKDGSDKCKVTVETPPVNECKPGVPVGDVRCTPTTPATPTTPVTPPPALPNTGVSAVGIVGLFGAVVTAAAFAHRYFMSRKLGY